MMIFVCQIVSNDGRWNISVHIFLLGVCMGTGEMCFMINFFAASSSSETARNRFIDTVAS